MAKKTNIGLVEYAIAQLGLPYWYGTFGNTATESLLEYKNRQYPGEFGAVRVAKARKNHMGKRVHDCIGIIKGYLWSDTPTSAPKYVASQDRGADGTYRYCKEKGSIGTMPDIPGVLVFMSGHVGVYIGNGYVVEAKGFDYGVIKTKLAGRGWKNWGKHPDIQYITDSNTTTSKPATSTNTSANDPSSPYKAGAKYSLKEVPLYSSSVATKSSGEVTGVYYLWDNKVLRNRIRITNSLTNVGKSGQVTGFINVSALKKTTTNTTTSKPATSTNTSANKTDDTATKTETVNKVLLKAGGKLNLKNVKLYATSATSKKAGTVNGSYYLWSASVVNNRIRITNNTKNVGKAGQVTGWINLSDISSTSNATVNTSTKTYPKYRTELNLNIRKGPGVNYTATGKYAKINTVYTIVETKKVGSQYWGKLQSGQGWICLAYCKKVS